MIWEICNEPFTFCGPVSDLLSALSLVVRLMTDCEVAVYTDEAFLHSQRSISSVVVTCNLSCVGDSRVIALRVVALRVIVLSVVVWRVVAFRLRQTRSLAESMWKAWRIVNAFKISFGMMKFRRRMLYLLQMRSLIG